MKTLVESILNESKEFVFNDRIEIPRQKMKMGFVMYNEDTNEIVGFQYDHIADYLDFMGADADSDPLAVEASKLRPGQSVQANSVIITRIW